MSIKCNIISFGKINRYYLLILLGSIFYLFLVLIEIESKLFSEEEKHPIIYTLSYTFGLCLSFFVMIIYKILNRSKREKNDLFVNTIKINDQKKITQTTKKEQFFWLLFVTLIDFTTFITYAINWIEMRVYLNYWSVNIISFSFFSYFILKKKLYKHHYLTIVTFIVFGVLFDLILGRFITDYLINNLINFVTEILFSLTYVMFKFYMLKKFIKPYEILFFMGFIESILGIITLIITTNNDYVDNFYLYYDKLDTKEVFFFILLSIDFFAYNLMLVTIIDIFSPFHIFLMNIFNELMNYFIHINEENPATSIITLIFMLICIFMALVYIEIIQLNFCGLSDMTNKNIELRARLDTDLINNNEGDKVEVSCQGYTFELNNINNKSTELYPLDDTSYKE